MSFTQLKPIKDKSGRPVQSQNGNAETHGSNKNQPTGEQLRIAQITSDKSDVDPVMLEKIKEVSDLTGRSTDEAWTALHDCNGDANQAVDLLFEKKDGDQDEWQEKKKKKKPTVTNRPTTSEATSPETKQEKVEVESERSENIPRGQRDRAPPRFQRGRGRGSNHNANGEKDVSASRERGPDRRPEGGRGRRGGRGGGGGGGGGGTGRNRGGRGFDSNASFETVPHIDTWTNETAQNGKNDAAIGAWTDVNEEWTADEWSGSLEESLVLTRSMPSRADAFPAASDSGSSQQQTLQSQVFVPSSRAVVGDALTENMSAAGYHQQTLSQNADQNLRSFDLNHLLPKFSEPYSMAREDQSAYISHFAKEATERIKNAVGIGSSSGHGVTSSGMDQLGQLASQSNNAHQVALSSRMKQPIQQHQQQQPQQPRPRLPPPSKIPSSAVEMPGSMGNAHLDVQFGNWDLPSSSSSAEVSNFLSDPSQPSQFTGQVINTQQSGSLSLTSGGKVVSMDAAMYQPVGGLAVNNSASSSVLSMQEMGLGSKSAAYQTNTAQAKDLGNSNKMVATPQILPFPTSNDDRKTIPFSSPQPSNQMSGQGSMSSQLGLSQLAYSSGVDSSSSMYKASSAASGTLVYSQPNISQHSAAAAAAVYGSSLQYPTTGPQTMHVNYPVTPTTQATYSYSSGEQASFNNIPASYSAMSTQTPTAFSSSSKSYGVVADKQSSSFPSVLSQVYESTSMGNAYPTGNQSGNGMQMTYQSGAMYPSNQPAAGPSYESLPIVSSGNYQNPATLYRAVQMSVNANDFPSGISESFPRNAQVVASATQQQVTPGKLMDGMSKLSVKDSTSTAISQQYDASASAGGSSLTSTVAVTSISSTGLVMTSTASSSLKTSTVQTTKSTVANKAAVNWPSGLPAPMMNLNPNYMIGQPPGFQLATFGYPAAQQTMPYSYEDIQILQQRYALQPTAYYDMQIQATTALPGRDLQATLTTASYVPGSDVKLAAPMEPQVSVAIQQTQQAAAAVGANQQSYSAAAAAAAAAALHPGYSYYYPGAPGILPVQSYYTPMIPMSGMAVPMVTNPTHGVTTSATQYQKPALYSSHAFGAGGQSQEFSKTFNPQASIKATGTTTGVTPSDMVATGNAFGKSHVQGFDKVGFHSGTPPPTSFSLALASGTQGGALGQPAIYGASYMQMMPHQSHSQIHHAMAPQDSSIAGRGGTQPNVAQAKVGSNKAYNTPYWAPGN